ncbi:cobalt-precorrin-6A reductase [Gordonia rhizosphera]|uniref:Precorrin-6X reductase n=1 Tax=Gordonia rhizosphera NBRC 16068 TaxID=1108045 RepID=K6WWL2_9ACTN|nr:cobalt-precorrin-6A reductase [Gordonia rhizosphera]GAB90954.1 precorrin-6X reductase [Gordonia rhizosphera NBRC 16068]
MTDRPILLLGGTGEARDLAARLVADGVPVISSLAGRVARPRLPAGEVRIGGFGGTDGLREWIREHDVAAVIDATHPFAATITEHAARAAAELGTPLLRLRRPQWAPGPGDRWEMVADMGAAAEAVRERGGRVFLTTGRQDVGVFADIADAWFLIRVVDPPTADLPPHHRLLASRGPYDLAGERTLLREHRIDALVTKNSGGELTRAKLVAAAELGVDVVMVQRPAEPAVGETVDSVDDAVAWLTRHTPHPR